jgi:hypothetical protein
MSRGRERHFLPRASGGEAVGKETEAGKLIARRVGAGLAAIMVQVAAAVTLFSAPPSASHLCFGSGIRFFSLFRILHNYS